MAADPLATWDSTSAEIDARWPKIPAGRFQETDTALGQCRRSHGNDPTRIGCVGAAESHKQHGAGLDKHGL